MAYNGNIDLYSNNIQNFLRNSIGLANKDYDFMKEALSMNIGDSEASEYDGYGDKIGTLSHPDLNSFSTPWFNKNSQKSSSDNYLDYIESVYFTDGSFDKNFDTQEHRMAQYDEFFSSFGIDQAKVNAVRGFDYTEGTNADIDNYVDDTRIRGVGDFYLTKALNQTHSYFYEDTTKSLSYAEPTNSDDDNAMQGFGITQGAYHKFGLNGEYGIKKDKLVSDGIVTPSTNLTDDVIAWSTSDHTYDSNGYPGTNGNLSTVASIVGTKNIMDMNTLGVEYYDEAQGTYQQGAGHLYYPFGNFYSITYSLGMYSASALQTKKFIMKSMFGYDLLDESHDDLIDLDYHNGSDTDSNVKQHKYTTGKKYYAGLGTRGTNYLDEITKIQVNFVKDTTDNSAVIRIQPIDAGNDNIWSTKALFIYGEAEGSVTATSDSELETPLTAGNSLKTYNEGVSFGRYTAYDYQGLHNKEDIISYTNKRFLYGKYGTLIGRFHGNEYESKVEARASREITETAISKFGVSHGRNLLKRNPKDQKTNGYSNPYCRVWTFHHQYSRLQDAIRPFDTDTLVGTDIASGRGSGQSRLESYGVKSTKSHLVRIAPTKNNKDSIKQVMFSIENLAWKHDMGNMGSNDVIGPNGGRIMWFPPYDIKFNENVSVNWNSNSFIGRGEQIYTYTNTDRSGTLSFTMLIDHPNVINKWQGLTGGEGIGDVDDTESSEQTLLRFFAGCDVLNGKASTQEAKTTKVKDKDTSAATVTADDKIIFYVFFPNNYSGADDSSNGSTIVKPIWYLMNGFGTQKGYSYSTDDSGKVVSGNSTLSDVMVIETARTSDFCVGYEVANGNTEDVQEATPISFRKNNGSSTTVKYIEDIYNDEAKNNVYKNYILGDDKERHILYATQKAEKRIKKSGMSYWAYRCDKAYEHQIMTISPKVYSKKGNKSEMSNYADMRCYGLNSMQYQEADGSSTSTNTYLTNYLTQDKNQADKVYSFVDVFSVCEETDIMSAYTHSESMEKLKEILTSYTITNVDVKGYASKDGYKTSNQILSNNRAKSVWAWMKNSKFGKYFIKGKTDIGVSSKGYGEVGASSIQDCNEIDYKIARRVRVEVSFSKATVTPTQTPARDNINVADNQTDRLLQEARKTIDGWGALSDDEIKERLTNNGDANYDRAVQEFAEAYSEQNAREYDEIVNKIKKSTAVSQYDGYGEEYKYFNELSMTDPFLHDKIVDKIKYFDPAFHSISPEGFNSRLTFLHQCTRQGSTQGVSAGFNNAENLAFGTPPVCVLRVGDFFNTKIVIDSLSIDYDNMQWDLNDEGIGVMPMIAKISLNFKFIGGSDLTGPISRLQNAITRNFYANTSVYDNLANTNSIK